MSAQDGPATPSAARSALRCVIWHSAAAALPGELLSSLSKRIGHMSVTTDGYTAFAELCTIERERRAAHAAGIPPAHAAVLLLVHPRTLTGAAEVVAAARLYAPTCTIWQYDRAAASGGGGNNGQGTNPRLRSVVEEDVRSWTAGAGAPASVSHTVAAQSTANAPALERNGKHHVSTPLIPSSAATPSQPVAARPRTSMAPALTHLTEDELRMLLSDDPVFPPTSPPQRGAGGRQ